MPLERTTTAEGILSTLLFIFLVNPVDIILISGWMTFAEAACIIEGETSSHIVEMIVEIAQLKGSEVPRINTGAVPVNLAAVAGKSSQLRNLQDGLSSPIPRLGKIQELLILSILVLRAITNTVIITAGDVAPLKQKSLS